MPEIVEIPYEPPDPLADYRSGSTEPWTADVLCALVQAKQPRVLLETGTYLGFTTLAIAQNLPEDVVFHTIDWTCGSPAALVNYPQVKFHRVDVMDWLRDYSGPPIDFAFVDDDHTAAHVFEELKLLIPKMASDGLICGHDVIGIFDLDKVFAHFGGISLKFPLLHAAGGLGLIQL